MTLGQELRRAYDAAGEAWGSGPSRVYTALAAPLLDAAGDVGGRLALDVGTGSGVVAQGLVERGARVIATDASWGMLRHEAALRCPAVVADVRALPFPSGVFALASAGFVLNHLPDPEAGFAELGRVAGRVVATSFAGEPSHSAKEVVDSIAAGYGFVHPEWYATVKRVVSPLLSSPSGTERAARGAGLRQVEVRVVPVRVQLTPEDLVAWRLGMAHLAGFVLALPPDLRAAMTREAVQALSSPEPLELEVLVLSASAG